MKEAAHTLTRRLQGRVARLQNRLSRARYFRGHGVHSPFVYQIVRRVFMCGGLLPGDRKLYEALRAEGIPERRAIQLQNLAIHCGYDSFGLNRSDERFCVVTEALSRAQTESLIDVARRAGATVAVMSPCATPWRQAICSRIIASHLSTTVDNQGYLLIFNNHLPKQHFRI